MNPPRVLRFQSRLRQRRFASCMPRATTAGTVAPTTCCVTHPSNNCAS